MTSFTKQEIDNVLHCRQREDRAKNYKYYKQIRATSLNFLAMCLAPYATFVLAASINVQNHYNNFND